MSMAAWSSCIRKLLGGILLCRKSRNLIPTFFAGDSGGDALFRSGAAESYMKKCPDEDTCCFSLREYMAIDFWGRKCTFPILLCPF